MKENVVIFICTFDPFHRGKAIYSFANYCIGYDEPIPLEDGTTKLFLNTATKQLRDLDLELQLFYDYVRGKPAQTNFTKELDATISRMKQEKEERNMYLTYTSRMMEFRRDGYEEGFSIGIERGVHQKALETAKKLLARGDSPAEIADLLSLSVSQVQELKTLE